MTLDDIGLYVYANTSVTSGVESDRWSNPLLYIWVLIIFVYLIQKVVISDRRQRRGGWNQSKNDVEGKN